MKRVWFDLHRWVGLKLSIVISFILITGTLATVSNEIDWLLDADKRVLPAYETDVFDWQGIYDAARQEKPDWAFYELIKPVDPWFAVQAIAVNEEGRRVRLFVNPRTLEVQGEGAWMNAQRLFRDTHRRLMIRTDWGMFIVSSFSLLLLVSLITGLVVYKKFWRGFFKMPRTRDRRTMWGDLHRLGGVWSIWFVAMMVVTGIWYFAEVSGQITDVTVDAFEAGDVLRPMPERILGEGEAISLNDMAAKAKQRLPGFEVERVGLPQFLNTPAVFYGQSEAVLVNYKGNWVALDPRTADVNEVLAGTTLTVMQRVTTMADHLHFGTFGGLATKILYFVFGLILSAMALSGAYIYSKRIRKSLEKQSGGQAKAHARMSEDSSTNLQQKPARAYMGRWKWLAGALVFVSLASIAPYYLYIADVHALSGKQLKGQLHGCEFRYAVAQRAGSVSVSARISPVCASALNTPSLKLLDETGKALQGVGFDGEANALSAELSLKDTVTDTVTLELVAVDAQGIADRIRVPLALVPPAQD